MPQRNAVTWTVYLDEVETALFHPLSIVESVGSSRLDTAILEVVDTSIESLDPADYIGHEIALVNNVTSMVNHWGKIGLVQPLLTPQGEVLTITSRTEMYHFGGRIDGVWVYDPVNSAPVQVDWELVFNPLIDGQIYGNKNNTFTASGFAFNTWPLFLDPESVRTAAAQSVQGANAGLWSLAEAVLYLTGSLNATEAHVANLSLATLNAIFTTSDLVQNVFIPKGAWLGQALDLLLDPLGYDWRVKRTAVGAREFDFWKRGSGGTAVFVYHQALGSTLSVPRMLTETNVETTGVMLDTARLANDITVRGGYREYEVTIELHKGWDEDDDALIDDIFALSRVDEAGELRPLEDWMEIQDVWRKWVLNEAGDYIGLRTEIDGLYTTAFRTALDSAGIDGQFIPRRRLMLPMLTVGLDGRPLGQVRGVEVEFSLDDGSTWEPVPNWSCMLLESECGVYFAGDHLPDEFAEFHADLRIRATFTLQSDVRLEGSAGRLAGSPHPDEIPLVLDLPDRFRYRDAGAGFGGLTKYDGSGLPTLAVNDTSAIQAFASFVRDISDRLDVGGAIQLEGLDHTYILSHRVQGISGKGVSFELRASTGYYPAIVAIERHVESQKTILHIARQTEAIPLPPAPRGTQPRFSTRGGLGRTRNSL